MRHAGAEDSAAGLCRKRLDGHRVVLAQNAFFARPVCSSMHEVPRPTAAKQRRKAGDMIPVPERLRGVQ